MIKQFSSIWLLSWRGRQKCCALPSFDLFSQQRCRGLSRTGVPTREITVTTSLGMINIQDYQLIRRLLWPFRRFILRSQFLQGSPTVLQMIWQANWRNCITLLRSVNCSLLRIPRRLFRYSDEGGPKLTVVNYTFAATNATRTLLKFTTILCDFEQLIKTLSLDEV